jgi:hypothetical protein
LLYKRLSRGCQQLITVRVKNISAPLRLKLRVAPKCCAVHHDVRREE